MATTVDGAIDRDIFESFITQILSPTLQPGEWVVMDNLSSHKGGRVRELIESRGAHLLYLPPYSPDLNPIEPAFSKIKQALRRLGTRSMHELWTKMQSVLDHIRPPTLPATSATAGIRYMQIERALEGK